jgi:hypothetical protein
MLFGFANPANPCPQNPLADSTYVHGHGTLMINHHISSKFCGIYKTLSVASKICITLEDRCTRLSQLTFVLLVSFFPGLRLLPYPFSGLKLWRPVTESPPPSQKTIICLKGSTFHVCSGQNGTGFDHLCCFMEK